MRRQSHLTKEAKISFRRFFDAIAKGRSSNTMKPGDVSREAQDTITENRMNILSKAHDWAKDNPVLAVGTGLAAIGAGDVVKEHVIDPAILKAEQVKAFNAMEKKVPSLKGIDEQQKKDYFNVITTYAPGLSRNPYVAGNLVNKFKEYGGPDHKLVQDIIKMEKDSNVAGKGSIDKMVSRAGAVIGGLV